MKSLIFLVLGILSVYANRCKVTPHPPSVLRHNTCAFYCPVANSLSVPSALCDLNISHSLHGYWSDIFNVTDHISYDEFLNKQVNTTYFIDSTTLTQTLGCGQYREYVKHGSRSGMTFDQWIAKVNECLSTFQPNLYHPHQCKSNGTHNLILSLTSVEMELVGCAPNKPFVNSCIIPQCQV